MRPLVFVERECDMGEGWNEYQNGKPIRRNVGVIQLRFLIGLLHLIGVWSGKDKKTTTMKTQV
jgi:hypothetical protein